MSPELCLCSALAPVGHTSKAGPNGWLSHSVTLDWDLRLDLSLRLLRLPRNGQFCSQKDLASDLFLFSLPFGVFLCLSFLMYKKTEAQAVLQTYKETVFRTDPSGLFVAVSSTQAIRTTSQVPTSEQGKQRLHFCQISRVGYIS